MMSRLVLLALLAMAYFASGQRFPMGSGGKFPGGLQLGGGQRVSAKDVDCVSPEGRVGRCTTNAECSHTEGIARGRCSEGNNVCCITQKSCGDTITRNNSYYVNPDYPSQFNGSGNCIVTVNRIQQNICQLRLDFLDFDLAPPVGGYCNHDQLIVVGVHGVPVTCGINNGQHMYIDFPQGVNSVPLSIVTTGDQHVRQWEIKVSQIECNSPSIAPSGCFLYYTGASGSFRSFNYDANEEHKGYQMGMNYGICIRRESGFCGIKYTAIAPFEFGAGPDLVDRSATEASCQKDFVLIPNGAVDGRHNGSNKYCGGKFHAEEGQIADSSVFSRIMPFVVYVITDRTPDMKSGRGFSFTWQQTPCTG